MARPERLELPTFWSVADEIHAGLCSCRSRHDRGDCDLGCGCGWCAPELYDALELELAFWSIVDADELPTLSEFLS